MIEAVVSDFGGVLTTPLLGAFERVQDRIDVPPEAYGTRKPEPEIYAITLERLGLPPAACAFVDDLDVNVKAARDAGMRGIVFRDTAQAIAELTSLLA